MSSKSLLVPPTHHTKMLSLRNVRRAKNTRSLCRFEDAIVWVFECDTLLRKIGTNVRKKIKKLMKSSPFSTYKCDLKSITHTPLKCQASEYAMH